MNVMKKLFFLLLVAAWACDDAADYHYNAPRDHVYFDFADTSKSHITFSFAYFSGIDRHVLHVPVRVSGPRVPRDRRFRVELLGATTATPGLHFAPLQDEYILAADSGRATIPVELLLGDPRMVDSTFVIALGLVDSPDLDVDFPTNSATIAFSNRLERPEWWNYWQGELSDYSRTKHYLFLCMSGTVDLSDPGTEGERTLHSLNFIKNFKAALFDPVAWVARHPEFACEETAPGSGTYSFYKRVEPERAVTCTLVNMGPMGVRYMFFDENNNPIFYT
jgi:hypothetical protein